MKQTSRRFMKPVLVSLDEAVLDVTSGSSLAIGGFGFSGVPFELMEELRRRPAVKDLTLIMGSMSGEDCGVGPLAVAGQLKKTITAYMGENKVFSDCFQAGKLEVELCPMGSLVERLNAGGTGIKGFYTTTGMGTAVSEGRIPQRFAPDGSGTVVQYSAPRETRCVDGEWCVFEPSLKTDFALIKAWKADRRGNCVFRGVARNFNLAAAKASRVCILQVDELVECGELDPNYVHMPGVYVDRIVHVPNSIQKIEHLVKLDESGGKAVNHNDAKHRMARRAALEVEDGMVLNLGIGTPTFVTSYIPPAVKVLLMAGNGLLGVGPFPRADEVDPDVLNASKQTVTVDRTVGATFLDCVEAMGLVRGGYVDMAMMGAMEVAENGDLANWMVPGKRMSGMGGGMELVQSGCRVIILTNHVNNDGTPKLLRRCRAPLTGRGVVDKIITDLAVFDVVKSSVSPDLNSLLLTELAEGVTLDEVKAKTEAVFKVSPDLKSIPLATVIE
ncbi:3-oxoacid CoA-transferase [Strigomonas culicis]|uniref:Succinyl-CoA:3-ketoacid-coenzyme A transferase n=1 Tax=Strigomonas culicis TaxID=28005 RepID=S9TSL2_9TRYP|nr:3-oxoacid CoA-transferase [Strigomonas culicis]|eukprot:EPY19549.1 3-oxoacid CoA-transferase [Strigomonas culicis]